MITSASYATSDVGKHFATSYVFFDPSACIVFQMLRVIFSKSEANTFLSSNHKEAPKAQLDNKTLILHDFKFTRILFHLIFL